LQSSDAQNRATSRYESAASVSRRAASPGVGIDLAIALHLQQSRGIATRHSQFPGEGEVMFRKSTNPYRRLLAAAAAMLCASAALADDSSMSVLTGDSYAYFNNLDNNPGTFNTARAPQMKESDTAMKMPKVRETTEKPILLADRPRISLPSPFSDNKGA
jgi:hypothetical protein